MISPKEEYPHPTFTPSEETYDRVEIEDSYVMLSGNRNSPPVHRQYSLLNGNEIKEDNAMDLNKIAGRFKRAWANAGRALNVKLPDVQAITQSRFPDEYDVSVVFDQHVTAYVDTFTEIGCVVDRLEYNVADLKLPAAWLAVRERIESNPDLTLSPLGKLNNALLDAGIADWLEIQLTPDQTALEVEFLDHPTAEQIAALKRGYDVLTFEELTYTFVERTSGQTAPLVDPAKAEQRLRDAWGGARAGKILTVEATDNPRQFIVTTRIPIPASARFSDHGLTQIELIDPSKARIEIGALIWSKLLEAANPIPAVTDTTEAATVADGDTEPLVSPEPAPLPELDERDLEINALKAQVENLQGIIRSLTPVTSEWQTLSLKVKREGSNVTAHPEIGEQVALGWQVHTVQYAPNGEDRLLVLMERKPRVDSFGRLADHASAWARANNGANGRESRMIVGGGGDLYDVMIRDMNAELADTANALRNAVYGTGNAR